MARRRKRNLFKRFWDAFWRPEMLILPGQIAFFLFLSLVPTVTLISYTCAYIKVSNSLIQTLLTNVFNSDISNLITPIITSTKITPTFFITLGVGYFIASNGMASIIVASNTIYGIKDSGFFRRRLKAIIMELILVILLLFIVIFPLLGNSIVNIMDYLSLDNHIALKVASIINYLTGPISWIVIFLVIKMVYTIAPDKKIPSHSVNGGALFTTVCWILLTYLYSYYISHYANYSAFYGSLANIVILMLWIYILAYIFVIGLAMNYREELEKTGVIEIEEVIKASANSAPVMEEKKPEKKKRTRKKKKEPVVEEPTEEEIAKKKNKKEETKSK